MPRYTVEQPPHGGTYFDSYCWKVVDTQTTSAEFRVVMSGSRSQARRWARDLNAR